RNGAESNIEAVRPVDSRYRNRQVGKFLLAELRARCLIYLIRNVAVGDQRDRLGPGQRGAFAVTVERRFTPHAEQIKPLFALAVGPQLLGVHVDAMTAAIDLRSSELHQFEKGMFEAAFANEDMQIADRLGALRRCLAEIHSSFHGDYPFIGFQLGLGANSFWASGRVMSVSNNSNSPLA